MAERRASVTLSFVEADYARLKRYGRAVGFLATIAAIVGLALIVELVRSIDDLASQPPGRIVLTAFVILVWLGLAMFASLVARDAAAATDTHVVLEVGAALAVGCAVIASQLLALIRGAGFVSGDAWTVLSFVFAWVFGYFLYRVLGEHLRSVFRLERELSPPPRWLIIVFSITVWMASTVLLADLVSATSGSSWAEGPRRFFVLIPPVPLALVCYVVAVGRWHAGRPDAGT